MRSESWQEAGWSEALERGNGSEMPHYCKVKSGSWHFEVLLDSHRGLQGENADDLRQKELVCFPVGHSCQK